jgi:hypothetical protein
MGFNSAFKGLIFYLHKAPLNNVQYINTVQDTLNILNKLVAIELQEGKHKAMLTSEEIYKPSHSQKFTTAATRIAAENI